MTSLFTVVLFGAAISLASSEINHICGSNIDLDCLRNYFSENGHCSVVHDARDSLHYDDANLPIYLSSIQLTAVITELSLNNLNGQLEEFYKDEETGNLVMTVGFSAFNGSAPSTIFSIFRTGQEPIVFTDYAKATYPVSLTAVIPACDGVTVESLKNAQYSAHFPNYNAELALGPKFTDSDNPVIQETLTELFANVPAVLKEIFLTKAEIGFLAYLQNYVCDFDLYPVLNKYDLTTLSSINEVNTDDQPKSRPCANSDDMTECVRDFFEEQETCSVVRESTNQSVERGLFYDYAPIINMTIELDSSEFFGLDGEILDLYINEESQNLVVTVNLDNVIKNSPDGKAIFNRKGQLPLVIVVPTVSNFSMVTITATIPIKEGLTAEAIKKAFIGATIGEGGFDIGSAFTESQDPTVLESLQILATQSATVFKEVFVTEAYSYFIMFLQKNICNFGIESSYSLNLQK